MTADALMMRINMAVLQRLKLRRVDTHVHIRSGLTVNGKFQVRSHGVRGG